MNDPLQDGCENYLCKKKDKILYREKVKMKSAKYGNSFGLQNAVRRCREEFPNILILELLP